MAIINQNPSPVALPNFCNMGVGLRILLIVNGASVLAAMARAPALSNTWDELVRISAPVQPILLLSLIALCLLRPLLNRLEYPAGVVVVFGVEFLITTLVYRLGEVYFGEGSPAGMERAWAFTAAGTAVVLAYFHLRQRALSPALGEARLQALQARIRPHFLFNSINAVLGLIRVDPKRAETALEDMADLFRVLMADNRHLTTLEQELSLCRAYLDLEQLRLGERLCVVWHIEKMPADALVPPLVLQPLLENAVYHGIEPCREPGELSINIYHKHGFLHIVLRNPYRREGAHHAGNKMAMANIRERLALHFDAEARLDTKVGGNCYQVHMSMPYVTQEKAA